MNKLIKTGRKALLLLTTATLFLSLPLGMDAKKRSSNRSRTRTTTTTTTNQTPRKTIRLETNVWYLYLYPSGKAYLEQYFLYKSEYNGTWTLRSRTIGYGNSQTYYEVNIAGESMYWAFGSNYAYKRYTDFINSNYDKGFPVSWAYM